LAVAENYDEFSVPKDYLFESNILIEESPLIFLICIVHELYRSNHLQKYQYLFSQVESFLHSFYPETPNYFFENPLDPTYISEIKKNTLQFTLDIAKLYHKILKKVSFPIDVASKLCKLQRKCLKDYLKNLS